jgi:YjbE family integral membrane protein
MFDMWDIFTQGGFFALLQVILIDVVLAGDNAVVIGMSAARVEKTDRKRVIFWGLATAVILRIVLAVFAVHLLKFTGLVIAGGILLLWVSWRLWRDVSCANKERQATKLLAGCENGQQAEPQASHQVSAKDHLKAVQRAIVSIAAADISMSLDNVLAVAGAARDHLEVLVIGLSLSVALMGFAASLIARLLHRYPWISYAGLFIVLFVALRMIWGGLLEMQEKGWFEHTLRLFGT